MHMELDPLLTLKKVHDIAAAIENSIRAEAFTMTRFVAGVLELSL